MSEPLAPLPGGLALAASYQPTVHGLTLYSRRAPGPLSDLATALYGPTARVGHASDRKPPRGHLVACYVTATGSGPALPVLVPDPDYIKPGPAPGPPGSQRTARLVVRVTPAELEGYQAAAGRAGVSMGEWVRGKLAHDPDDIRARNAMAMLQRASKYVREDGAETPRSTRLARLVTQIDDLLSRDLRSSQSADDKTAAAEKEHGG